MYSSVYKKITYITEKKLLVFPMNFTGTLVPSSSQKDTIEESSALESPIVSTVVPVVVSLLVILGIALTVVAVMWRKRTR